MYSVQVPNEKELQLIGKYIVGLYRLNYMVVAGYVSANTFESIINIFLKAQDKLKFQCETHECLHEKIKSLNIHRVNNDFKLDITFGSLLELKDTRNDIVHGFIRDIEHRNIKYLVEFIWDVVSIGIDGNTQKIDLIDIKTAQYWVRDFEVITEGVTARISSGKNMIQSEDFLDLYKMRHRLLELEQFLDTRKRLGQFKKYSVDNISAVNPTSAYVWLAIVDEHKQSRKKISGPSISVLATPIDIRIYLDFGGFAFDYRKKYFKFLQNYDLRSLEIDTNNLYFFDIDWYSFIDERHPFHLYLDDQSFKKKAHDLHMIINDLDNQVPLSWNKLLIGYILDRKSMKNKEISFDEMWQKINYIIHLYQEYQSFIGEEIPTKVQEEISTDKFKDLIDKFSM